MTPRTFIVIPAHNRLATTLACLHRLRRQGVFGWAAPIVVDDGSTDGTGDAVRLEFPDLEVLRGNGNLFWTGATELGMRRAVERGAEFVFWLNDDCEPQPGALAALLATARERHAVAGGVCALPRSGQAVYGGFKRGRRELEFISAAPGDVTACDALNGNLVCVPRAVIDAIGFPDGRRLPHASGDTDYTLRATERGHEVLLVGDARAQATPHNRLGYASWLLSGMSVREVWATLVNPRAYGYLPADMRFRWRHWGWAGLGRSLWMVAKRVPVSLAILTVPLDTRRRWWSSRSAAWRYEQMIRAESGHE
jgi:glycosyltransferase involved in cell wall biosynthesis